MLRAWHALRPQAPRPDSIASQDVAGCTITEGNEDAEGDQSELGPPPTLAEDEALARLLAREPDGAAVERHTCDEASDHEIARLLQQQEESRQPPAPPQPESQTPPPVPRPVEPIDCAAFMPVLGAFLGSGLFFGCAAGMQVASMLGLGNCAMCMCALCGSAVGHAASEPQRPRHRRQSRREGQGVFWEQLPDSESDEQTQRLGLSSQVIEDHSVLHTFRAPLQAVGAAAGGSAPTAGGDGTDCAVRCMVCMEDFVSGDSIRTLPCLHRYHKSCIDKWFCRSSECPICKRSITETQLPPEPPPSQRARGGLSLQLSRRFLRRERAS